MNAASRWLRVAAILGFLGVVIGAFGAHGLRSALESLPEKEPNSPSTAHYPAERRMAVYETGVQYHLVHALALLSAGLLMTQYPDRQQRLRLACWAFLIGILLFSGSLYALGLTGMRWLGAITPLGGVAFLIGWVFLALACSAGNRQSGSCVMPT